jgi:hypothetical protein
MTTATLTTRDGQRFVGIESTAQPAALDAIVKACCAGADWRKASIALDAEPVGDVAAMLVGFEIEWSVGCG